MQDWYSTAWYWMLHPLPVDVAGPAGWTPPLTGRNEFESGTLIYLQVSTVLLLLSAIAIGYNAFSPSLTSLARPADIWLTAVDAQPRVKAVILRVSRSRRISLLPPIAPGTQRGRERRSR